MVLPGYTFRASCKGLAQVLDLEHIGDADLVLALAGSSVESGHRSHHHGLSVVREVLQQPLCEFLTVIYGQAHSRIECSHGGRAYHTGNGAESLYQEVSSLYVFVPYGLEI